MDAAISHRSVDVHGLQMHLAEAGPADGPVVLLLHGFPECWYSWRHQLVALAVAGFRAVAPDQRGYARTDAPGDVADYTILHLVGDVIGLLDTLGAEQAVVVGHDWGAPVAWHTALLRPDRVRGVVGLSVPYRGRGPARPTEALAQRFGPGYYMLYFQPTGVADGELAADPRATFRRLLSATSGGTSPLLPVIEQGAGLLDLLPEPERLPAWLTEQDLDVYVDEYRGRGFTGGLNWYRNLDRSWGLTAAWHEAPITRPTLFVAGEQDLVIAGVPADLLVDALRSTLTDLRGAILLPGCGHWTQQERPEEVNAAIIEFAGAVS